MKRNATWERWWKRSKSIWSSTKLVTSFLNFDKPEQTYRKKTKDKSAQDISVWDKVLIKTIRLYSSSKEDEQALRSKFAQNSIYFWLNYSVELEILWVIKEWKLITYTSNYDWIPVRFDNRFTRIFKVT